MILAKDVYLKYTNGTMALKNINLVIPPGEVIYITGPSGSGKTSLLKLFMGMEYPSMGSLMVIGKHMNESESANIRHLRQQMGPIFQEFKLINGRTVMENVMLGMRFLGFSSTQMKKNAREALMKVGLEPKMFSLVENLSWGERQRAAIARAVARKPTLILADEPTGNLDKDNALNILNLLTSFRDKDTTVIITTHATHLIGNEENCKFIRMDKGQLYLERLVEAE